MEEPVIRKDWELQGVATVVDESAAYLKTEVDMWVANRSPYTKRLIGQRIAALREYLSEIEQRMTDLEQA